MLSAKRAKGICLTIAGLLACAGASADTVEVSQTVVVSGVQFDSIELHFDAPGTVNVTVTDLETLSGALDALSFAVSSSTELLTDVIEVEERTGSLQFFYTGALAAVQVFARAMPYGAYRVNAQMTIDGPSPVALPSSILLLGSVLGIAIAVSRWRARRVAGAGWSGPQRRQVSRPSHLSNGECLAAA